MPEKPILFNTDMVRAILDGRKTQTRRLVKNLPLDDPCATYVDKDGLWISDEDGWHRAEAFSPIKSGDILWVRETWSQLFSCENPTGRYVYKATDEYPFGSKYIVKFRWHPSIHMPRKAARIFLRVTDVRPESLQDITEDDVCAEGAEKIITRCQYMDYSESPPEPCYNVRPCKNCIMDRGYPELFCEMIWNPTIKKADLPRYGWETNPWVWVITFERINKPEGWLNV